MTFIIFIFYVVGLDYLGTLFIGINGLKHVTIILESDTDLRAGRWSIIRKRKSEDVGSRRSRIFPKNRSTVPAGTHSESNKMSAYSWRRRIWLILEEPSSSMIARVSRIIYNLYSAY